MTKSIITASAVILVLLSGNTAVAQSDGTMLFERDDSHTKVAMLGEGTPKAFCMVFSRASAEGPGVAISMNGSDLVGVGLIDPRPSSPIAKAKDGAALPLSISVGGTRQTYQSKKTGGHFAEAALARASQNHLRRAVQSRSGMEVKIGDAEAVSITVEPEAVSAFEGCVMSLIRSRMDDAMQRLQRMAP